MLWESLKSNVTLTVAAAQDWIKDWDRKVAEDFTAETEIHVIKKSVPVNGTIAEKDYLSIISRTIPAPVRVIFNPWLINVE
mgnify:CR=1 FL=1